MILTGKAAEIANELEDFEKRFFEYNPGHKFPEITEDEQVNLLGINTMFPKDELFKNYICGCFQLYIRCVTEGNNSLKKLFLLMKVVNKML